MKILLFVTGFRHLEEYGYFNRFLRRLNSLPSMCDLFIYCNNPHISGEIVARYQAFEQKNKYLHLTTLNVGFKMGGVEAVSRGMAMGAFEGYDYVVHLHPDVFIVDDSPMVAIMTQNLANDCVFFVNRGDPDDSRFFCFDFFIFKPRLLTRNVFLDALYTFQGIPEHWLSDMLANNAIAYHVVKRFAENRWHPRRVDEHLGLYHEHDLGLVDDLLNRLPATAAPSPRTLPKWQPPLVALHPSDVTDP